MTIVEIARERGVGHDAKMEFDDMLEKRGFIFEGMNELETVAHFVRTKNGETKRARSWEWGATITGGQSGFRNIPYTAITIDLINAVAGEEK
jgi:hypothetical protein